MIKAMIFDFDGTIIDTESLWYKVFCDVLMEKFELELPLAEFAKVIGTTDELLFEYISTQTGKPADQELIKELTGLRFSELKETLVLREGIEGKIKEAKNLGIKLGIASSSGREWVESFLEKFGLLEHFQTIKTKEDVKIVKPDPALYVKAMDDLHVVPAESLAIEDSINGSLAAIRAGMHCIVVPNEVTSFLTFDQEVKVFNTFSSFRLADIEKEGL
ncbi:HAD family hydrolase [Bacillus sp. CECT 9360]|uniref:HAD family hydrolase n=1 Tax=Bacillus sp. CECT 9360 TaxID=2845821 RepID=UPI001E39A7D5|nr:HAD family hydrolase [Bacillus sp. CECT 9360]CAH0344255.1 Hexitol phosphatase B [Bacillus sp. CECT 9360]